MWPSIAAMTRLWRSAPSKASSWGTGCGPPALQQAATVALSLTINARKQTFRTSQMGGSFALGSGQQADVPARCRIADHPKGC